MESLHSNIDNNSVKNNQKLDSQGHVCRCWIPLGAETLSGDFDVQIYCPQKENQCTVRKFGNFFWILDQLNMLFTPFKISLSTYCRLLSKVWRAWHLLLTSPWTTSISARTSLVALWASPHRKNQLKVTFFLLEISPAPVLLPWVTLCTRRSPHPKDQGWGFQNNPGLAGIFILVLQLFSEVLCRNRLSLSFVSE